MGKIKTKIRIEIDEKELWYLLHAAISNNAKGPKYIKAILPTNRVMKELREISF